MPKGLHIEMEEEAVPEKSIKDHDILAERSSNLQKFTVGFFLLLAGIEGGE